MSSTEEGQATVSLETLGARALAQQLADMNFDLSLVDDSLPEQAKDLAGVIGYQGVLQVISKIPGTSWEFPRLKGNKGAEYSNTSVFSELEEAIGSRDLAVRMCKFYSGEKVYIPKCSDALRRLRDIAIHREIESLLKKGLTMYRAVRKVSVMFGLSDRWVWEILKSPNELKPAIESK